MTAPVERTLWLVRNDPATRFRLPVIAADASAWSAIVYDRLAWAPDAQCFVRVLERLSRGIVITSRQHDGHRARVFAAKEAGWAERR